MSQSPKESGNKPNKYKRIVCCFDGTGNKPGQEVTMITQHTQDSEQVVYYQPGIGFGSDSGLLSQLYATWDEMTAASIHNHVKEGYKFIARSYTEKEKQKIYLFGFSRGAYVVRLLALMIAKIGILKPEHLTQMNIDLVFSSIQQCSSKNLQVCKDMCKLLTAACIEFIGLWDTVASTSFSSLGIKFFHHALALDERRIRFTPELWNKPKLYVFQDLHDSTALSPSSLKKQENQWIFSPSNSSQCDIEEVWFAGCHADVGGGSSSQLSNISLRWMIKECHKNGGLDFDQNYLHQTLHFKADNQCQEADNKDSLEGHTNDELKAMILWWILEIFIYFYIFHSQDQRWYLQIGPNLGQGWYTSFDGDGEVKIHQSVQYKRKHSPQHRDEAKAIVDKIEEYQRSIRAASGEEKKELLRQQKEFIDKIGGSEQQYRYRARESSYQPAARNWKDLQKLDENDQQGLKWVN
ncbi:hypothetical protein BDN72DRAFT_900254 [Pluteus cervinus]|uniref:Uncharacterized protein n=1 Tax=Pluteus cervinus TaxID=181527 RepID=A0ACD3AKU5_9AGAR|nr:hypothetical protein BDN72DRAFT_900254 [Pluteus cervinus]